MPDTQTDDGRNTGRIVEIKGVVIDAVFSDRLPEIYTALAIEVAEQDGNTRTLIAEVQQHLGDDRVRAVAMDSTDGLSRGTCASTPRGRSRFRSATRRSAASGTSSASRSTRPALLPQTSSAGRSIAIRLRSATSRPRSRRSRPGSRSSISSRRS